LKEVVNLMSEFEKSELVAYAVDVVTAYVSNNTVSASELPQLISSVHGALTATFAPAPVAAEKPVPAVPVKKSITPDYLISLEDGRRYKSLKRHLGGRGLTPAEYRTKWGLPTDYPMVAPNYAKARSELAKAAGLGQRRKPAPAPVKASKGKAAPAKAARGRKAA
jgi:predicted transcriptional regulator